MLRSAIAILIIPLLITACRKQQQSPPIPALTLSPQMIARSRLSDGNFALLDRVLVKAKSGQPITLGFIGGSITWGQYSSKPEFSYSGRIFRWWTQQFPNSKITVVNAGIRGTGSGYGCVRVQHDLLSHHPDCVIVEFGVNDRADLAHAETYEGVIRQILADPDQPAVVELFTMHHDGTNSQEFQGEIGRRYQLPMISYRDAVWPEIQAGRLKWADVFQDVIHPNDTGHAWIATCVESLLSDAVGQLPADAPPIPPMPSARYSDVFSSTRIIRADQLTPTMNTGWTFNSTQNCWQSDRVGSLIEFACDGPLIELMYGRTSPLGGVASAWVDSRDTVRCDAWFDGTWEGYPQFDILGRDLQPGSHRVRVRITSEQNMYSHGHEFKILGLVRAGAGGR
jgi:lysophospholipase L1-like esterase